MTRIAGRAMILRADTVSVRDLSSRVRIQLFEGAKIQRPARAVRQNLANPIYALRIMCSTFDAFEFEFSGMEAPASGEGAGGWHLPKVGDQRGGLLEAVRACSLVGLAPKVYRYR